MPFGNIVCHQVYPLISWMLYSKSQSLLAAVLNRAAGLWGSRAPYEGSDTRATNCLPLPTYTQLKIIIVKKKKSLNNSSAIWVVLRPETGCQQQASSSSKESWPFSSGLTQMQAVNNCNLFFPRSHLVSSRHLTPFCRVQLLSQSTYTNTRFRCLR